MILKSKTSLLIIRLVYILYINNFLIKKKFVVSKFNNLGRKFVLQKQLKMSLDDCLKKINASYELGNFFEKPFKHLLIDDFFPEHLASKALEAFDFSRNDNWDISNDKDIEIKMRSTWQSDIDIPDCILPCVRILNSAKFLRSLSSIFKTTELFHKF